VVDFDKTWPVGSEAANLGDDKIRQNMNALEERIAAEHYFPDNASAARRGRHKFARGSLTDRGTAITAPADGNVFLRSTLKFVEGHNGTTWDQYLGYGVGTLAQRNALTDTLPTGYLWILTDGGYAATVWNGSSWQFLRARAGSDAHNFTTYEGALTTGNWKTIEASAGVDFEVALTSLPTAVSLQVEVEATFSVFNVSGATAKVHAQVGLKPGAGAYTYYHAGAANIVAGGIAEFVCRRTLLVITPNATQTASIRVWSSQNCTVNSTAWEASFGPRVDLRLWMANV
jgi:hypothetical protein